MYDLKRFGIGVASVAVASTLTLSLAAALTEGDIDHAKTQCSYGSIISLLSEDLAIKHQISGIKRDYQDKDGLVINVTEPADTKTLGYTTDIVYGQESQEEVFCLASDGSVLVYDENGNAYSQKTITTEDEIDFQYFDVNTTLNGTNITTVIDGEEVGSVNISR